LIDIESILNILPHRYPFLLVDRVLQLEAFQSITAVKNVTYNEEYFQGHFREIRIMPGVLIVEALAQAGGILIFHSVPEPEQKFVMFSKIDDMKFRRPVIPGDQLRLECKLVKSKGRFFQLHGTALVDGEVVAEGEMIASLFNREDLHGGK
jgi:beta-hydroxyacyl-ACP dehydratase FabZ